MRTPLRAALRLALTGCLGLATLRPGASADRRRAGEGPAGLHPVLLQGQERRRAPRSVRQEPVRPAPGRPGDQAAEGQRRARSWIRPARSSRPSSASPSTSCCRCPRARPTSPSSRRPAPRSRRRPGHRRRRQEREGHDRRHGQVDQAGRGGQRQGRHRVVQGADPPHHPAPQGRRQAEPAPDLDQLGQHLPHRHRRRRPQGPDRHADGRSDSLASVESYIKSKAKLGADAPVSWFFDINKAVKLAVQTAQAPRTAAARTSRGSSIRSGSTA